MTAHKGVNEGGPTGESKGPGGGFNMETGTIGQMAPALSADDQLEADVSHHDIFFAAVEATRMPMIVTDPRQPDDPIVFCNPAFQQMTGYTFEDIRRRNCRFLQGPDTDGSVIDDLRQAIDQRREIAVEVLN